MPEPDCINCNRPRAEHLEVLTIDRSIVTHPYGREVTRLLCPRVYKPATAENYERKLGLAPPK
jgi:hypothetical protein